MCLVLALSVGIPSAHGQAWLQDRGATYVKLSRQSSLAADQFRQDGSTAPYAAGLDGNGFEDRSTYLYTEHGLTGGTTLILMLPYKDLLVRTPHPQASSGLPGTDRPIERESTGFQNVYLGIRRDVTALLGLPVDGVHRAAVNLGTRLPLGYDREVTPAIGPGQIDLDIMLHYGVSLWPLPGYAQAGAGLRVRSGVFGLSRGSETPDYGNEWLLHLEAGMSVGRWALLQGLFFGTISNQPPETAFDPQNPVPTRQRYIKPGVGLTLYPFRWLGVSAQAFTTPWGANTERSIDWFVGVEARF
ncbi:MAG: hypothetical protein HKN29_10670 [Rhodothermales bacterium]|nr:hypothetical protein [Rhodothermales bacterium]